MNKIIIIGDIHAKPVWENILKANENADKVIFMGDYFDCFENVSYVTQIKNFEAICKLKIDNPNKYIILIGNHDFHYMKGFSDSQGYSGYQYLGALEIKESVNKYTYLMQMAHQEDKYLFTHAGITNKWAWRHSIDKSDLCNSINKLWENNITNGSPFGFSRDDYSGYGDHVSQGPLWVRPRQLKLDMVMGFTHIIGHTQTVNYTKEVINEYTNIGIIMTDTFDVNHIEKNGTRIAPYYTIENGNLKYNSLEWNWPGVKYK